MKQIYLKAILIFPLSRVKLISLIATKCFKFHYKLAELSHINTFTSFAIQNLATCKVVLIKNEIVYQMEIMQLISLSKVLIQWRKHLYLQANK